MKVTFSSLRWLSIRENSHGARLGAGSISSAIMCTLGPVKTENKHGCHKERHLFMKNLTLTWATKQKQEKENNNVINVKSWFRPLNLFRRRGCLCFGGRGGGGDDGGDSVVDGASCGGGDEGGRCVGCSVVVKTTDAAVRWGGVLRRK